MGAGGASQLAIRKVENRRAVTPIPTHANVIFKLDSSRGVELNLLQRLADDIVWLALALLGGFDRGGLVKVALVVYIELAEGIREGEDLVLREFGELSRCSSQRLLTAIESGIDRRGRGCGGRSGIGAPLKLEDIHRGGLGRWGELRAGRGSSSTRIAAACTRGWMDGRAMCMEEQSCSVVDRKKWHSR